jgi:hypothetical protein
LFFLRQKVYICPPPWKKFKDANGVCDLKMKVLSLLRVICISLKFIRRTQLDDFLWWVFTMVIYYYNMRLYVSIIRGQIKKKALLTSIDLIACKLRIFELAIQVDIHCKHLRLGSIQFNTIQYNNEKLILIFQ